MGEMVAQGSNRIWIALVLILGLGDCLQAEPQQRWTEKAANDWYARQPWLVGSNYTPATAINQLEMWQADTFDPKRIDLELGWAQSLGLNTMRVFLHDLPWQQDAHGFRTRIDTFLQLPTSTISSRFSFYSILVGTPIRDSGNNANRVLAFTILAGYKARALKPCRILRNIHVWRLT